MTPDEMIAAWRTLLADGHGVTFDPNTTDAVGSSLQYCILDILDENEDLLCSYEGVDADPLRAFEQAYRKWQEKFGRMTGEGE